MDRALSNRMISSDAVYSVLLRIPRGRVSTYGDIARILGCPGGSRAVGRILNRNPNPINVPCHRVVMADGTLGGYALGKGRKKRLLEREGLSFSGEKIADFKNCRIEAATLQV